MHHKTNLRHGTTCSFNSFQCLCLMSCRTKQWIQKIFSKVLREFKWKKTAIRHKRELSQIAWHNKTKTFKNFPMLKFFFMCVAWGRKLLRKLQVFLWENILFGISFGAEFSLFRDLCYTDTEIDKNSIKFDNSWYCK